MDVLNRLNWVDILLCIVAIRIFFIAIQRGIIVEAFKLVGAIATVFVTLHYCTGFSLFIQNTIHTPTGLSNTVSFALLWLFGVIVFKFIRDGFLILLHIEAHSLFDRWGSLALATVRALLIGSLVVVFLRFTTIDYVYKNTKQSLMGSGVVSIAPGAYEATFDNVVSKFFPAEKLNTDVLSAAFAERGEKKQVKQKKVIKK